MSQDSTESLPLSEETFDELKNMNGPIPDLQHIFQGENHAVDAFGISGEQCQESSLHDRGYFTNPSTSMCSESQTCTNSVQDHIWPISNSQLQNENSLPTQRLQDILPKPTTSHDSSPFVHIPSAITVPSSAEDLPGCFGFDIGFEAEKEHVTKACSWTYSHILHKLFAKRKTNVPIRFKLNVLPDADVFINLVMRVVLVYSKPENFKDVVQRCPNHMPINGEGWRYHLMEYHNSWPSKYETDVSTGQHFMTIPFRRPADGCSHVLENFQFMCLNTCPGGLNRKDFHIIFSLEYNGEVCGRKILKAKTCASPGRTKLGEEHKERKVKGEKKPSQFQFTPKHKVEASTLSTSTVTRNPTPVPSDNSGGTQETLMSMPKRIKQEQDDELFTIQVRGRAKYEEVLRYKEFVDLRDMVPPQLLENYRANSAPCGPNWLLQQQCPRSTSTSQVSSFGTRLNSPSTHHQSDNNTSTNPSSEPHVRYILKRHRCKHADQTPFTACGIVE